MKARGDAGLSLVEVVVAMALLTVVVLGLAVLATTTNRQINESNDRATAYVAAQQTVEFLNTLNVDQVLTYHNTTFNVTGLLTTKGTNIGRITTTDITAEVLGLTPTGQPYPPGQAYLVNVKVEDATTSQDYAEINIVRTR